jgi:hypothetical protein
MRAAGAILVAVAACAVSASASQRPTLAVTSAAPFTVRGAHFVPAERVTVTATVRGRHVRRVVANARGAFIARFRGVSVDRCQGWIVTARGNHGSRAALKIRPLCVPAGAP